MLRVSPFLLAVTTMGGIYYSVANLPLVRPTIQSSNEVAGTYNSLVMAHIDKVSGFNETEWDKLSLNDKIDLMQTVLNIETTYLGIHPVSIASKKLDNGTLGEHSYSDSVVYIDYEVLAAETPEQCLKTVLHEVRHAYQHYVIEMLDWECEIVQTAHFYEEARRWKYELENYVSDSASFSTYYNQDVERDARWYAEYSYYIYRDYIKESEMPS